MIEGAAAVFEGICLDRLDQGTFEVADPAIAEVAGTRVMGGVASLKVKCWPARQDNVRLLPAEMPCFHIYGRTCSIPVRRTFTLPVIATFAGVSARQRSTADLTPFLKWYWIVDCLTTVGYTVHLANSAAMQQYKGLKHLDDKHDAFWLAHMDKLGILPQGYINPKEVRTVRDLLRKRGHLVRLRTSLINSLQGIISRNCGHNLNGNRIKQTTTNHVAPLLAENEDLALSGEISKQSIDYLSGQIARIEKICHERIKMDFQYTNSVTIPGVGKTQALTISLETGPINRFETVGDYASYCRKVPSKWLSNKKRKGQGNSKNGNKYLSWAFAEAAEYARRYKDQARAFFNKVNGVRAKLN